MQVHSCRRLRIPAALMVVASAVGCSRSGPREAARTPGTDGVVRAPSTDTDPCALISQDDVSAVVGNPVDNGAHQGAGTCEWNTPNTEDVSVLLIAHSKGDMHEPYLCGDLRKRGGQEHVDGLDVARWKFSRMGMFNSGDFEGCGPKGYLSLQLSGRRDEPQLKEATFALARKAVKRQ